MTLLTRDIILTPPVRRYVEVDTLMGRVRLRSLTDREKCQIDSVLVDGSGKYRKDQVLTHNARLIAAMVVDEDGNRVFSDSDVPKIQDLESGMVGQVVKECLAHMAGGALKNGDATLGDSLP